MTEKQFFSLEADMGYLIFDSTKISKEEAENNLKQYIADFALETEDILRYLNENIELKQLLEKIRHELVCIDGLTATDSTNIQENIKDNYHMFQLEYSELLKKIDKVIK